MWILVVEALGALSLFLFIVWWTFGPTQRRERDALQKLALEEAERRERADGPDRDAKASNHDPRS